MEMNIHWKTNWLFAYDIFFDSETQHVAPALSSLEWNLLKGKPMMKLTEGLSTLNLCATKKEHLL